MLFKTRYLGFDPAQKGWMENIADYVAPMAIGEVMRGSVIAEVLASNGGRFAVGDMVFGSVGWTDHFVSNGEGLSKVETDLPPTAVLSVLGTTGVTAYCGLFKVGKPVAGDTVLVSGAAGRPARSLASSPRSPAAVSSASPGARTSANGWSAKPAMTRRSTTRRARSATRSRNTARAGLT